MAARTMWKGVLTWPGERVPVRLYSAVEDRSIHFHLLHDQDRERLKQRMVHPETEETVEYGETRKGLEVERGRFVVLGEDEMAELVPAASRNIEVLCFLDPAKVNHQWYERPYYLGPDDDEEAYFALVEALTGSGREGLVVWTMRGKQYRGALRVHEGYLMLLTIRHVDEVIETGDVPPPEGRDLEPRERDMAEQLIGALEEEFDPHKYRDEYRGRVEELIASKREGKAPPKKKAPRKEKKESLADALAASLQGAKR